MIKHLVKHGNSWAVIIDRPILDLLKLDPGSQVELTTDGTSIRISPVQGEHRDSEGRNACAKVNARLARAFRNAGGVTKQHLQRCLSRQPLASLRSA